MIAEHLELAALMIEDIENMRKIPTDQDFLIAYATVPGKSEYVSVAVFFFLLPRIAQKTR